MTVSSVKTGAVGISFALDNNYMEPIATTLVGSGGQNTLIFDDIPQTYSHLHLRYISRNAAATDTTIINFNGDFGSANYTRHQLRGDGSSGTAMGVANTYTMELPFTTYSGLTANVFGIGFIDILDYTNTNKNKVIRGMGGAEYNTSGYLVAALNNMWMSTDAIKKITISPTTGNLEQHSRFSLYGVKG